MSLKFKDIINELSSEIENEMEIIYKDKDIFVMMPKSQKISKLYGKDTGWCQVDKAGFEMWSKVGLLIRFLMRGGRKIRFTYFFKHMPFGDHAKGTYYWSNESGYHVLEGDGDPFNPQPKNPDKIRSIEKDILEQIEKIPEEAKQKVREFIGKHKEGYEYCYSDKEYHTKKELEFRANRETLYNIIDTYHDAVKSVFNMRPKIDIQWLYDDKNKKYIIQHVNHIDKKIPAYKSETFDNFEDAKKYLLDISQKSYNEHTKYFQPQSDFH